jgi:hypothetical protein
VKMLSWLTSWFAQPGQGVLRMLERRMIAPGYYETLPTAGSAFRYGIAADASGVQVCQPDGAGWAWRIVGELPTITVRTADSASTASGNFVGATASCNAGEICTGGGGTPTAGGTNNCFVTQSRPSGNGWYHEHFNNSGSSRTVRTSAVCLSLT